MARMNRSFHRENKACAAALDAPAGVDAGEAYRLRNLAACRKGRLIGKQPLRGMAGYLRPHCRWRRLFGCDVPIIFAGMQALGCAFRLNSFRWMSVVVAAW